MLLEDYITIIVVALIDLFFMITTVSFCDFIITKKIVNSDAVIEEYEEKQRRKRNRKNYEKSRVAKKYESIWQRIGNLVFDDDFDDESDELEEIANKTKRKKDSSDDEPKRFNSLDDITDEELDNIIAEAKKELAKEEAEGELDLPEYSDKILSIRRAAKSFQSPQELIDYVASKYNTGRMDVYDKKNNTIRQVQSFNTSADGTLYIYYKHYTVPDKFEPGRFSRVA